MLGAIVALCGVTEMDLTVAAVTISLAMPVTEFSVAVIWAVPACRPLATEYGIVATVVSEELQATLEVMLRVLPSLKVPIAVKEWLVWVAMVTSPPRVIECRLAALTVMVVES